MLNLELCPVSLGMLGTCCIDSSSPLVATGNLWLCSHWLGGILHALDGLASERQAGIMLGLLLGDIVTGFGIPNARS